MTILDDLLPSVAMPKPSVPPPNEYEPWADILARYNDGFWYLIKEYQRSNTAKAVASRERLRAGDNWEFRHGRTETGTFGVWARNLDGPMVGEDEQ